MKNLNFTLIIIIISVLSAGCENWQKYADRSGNPVAEVITSIGTIVIEFDPKTAPATVENFIGLAEGTKEWINPADGMRVKKPFFNGLIFYKAISDFMILSGCPLNSGNGGPGFSIIDEAMDNRNCVRLTGTIQTEAAAELVYQEVILPYLKKSIAINRKKDPVLLRIVSECSDTKSVKPVMRYPVEFYINKTGRKEPLMTGGVIKSRIEYGSVCMVNSEPDSNGSRFFIFTGKKGAPWLDGKNTVFGKVVDGMDVARKIQDIDKYSDGKPVKDILIKEIKIYKSMNNANK